MNVQIEPEAVAPIGAINAAIIAGNPPELRIDRLRKFWTEVSADDWWSCFDMASDGRE